jgi:PKD repeat protein
MIPVLAVAGGHGTQNPPTITSDGGGSTASVDVTAPAKPVTTVTATGTGHITFSKAGGADAALFSLNASTGVLAFISNSVAGTYHVTVRASNAFGHDDQAITVNVT